MSTISRLRSLDVFRGLTVAAMVLVNSPGSDDVFSPLRHADWNGWTPTDLIFPAFLVIMGVASAFSFAVRRERGEEPGAIARRVLLRAAGLFALGLLVDFFIYREAGGMRYLGVLQRIAFCYLGVEAFLLMDRPSIEPAAVAGLLIAYWLVLTRVPVPGHGPGVLTPEGNIAYWLDRRFLSGHLLDRWGDPEGLLSTVSAWATALMGLVAGRRLVRDGPCSAQSLGAAGLILATLGAVWGGSLPLNKHIWTSSFALFSGGLSLAGISLCLRHIESRPARWAAPFEALGRRALLVYVVAGLVYGIQEFVRVTLPDGSPGNLKLWLNTALFGSWLPPSAASLAYALVFTGTAVALAAVVRPHRVEAP